MRTNMTIQKIDLNKYSDFVEEVTSRESNEHDAFIERVNFLKGEGCNISLLMTAAFGLSAESGEFTEVVKKIVLRLAPKQHQLHVESNTMRARFVRKK